MKRSGPPQRTAGLRRTPLRRRSKATEAVYGNSQSGRRSVVATILDERPFCEIGPQIRTIDPAYQCSNDGAPSNRATQVHERRERSDGGGILNLPNLLASCSGCNTGWIPTHRDLAETIGVIVSEASAEWADLGRCDTELELRRATKRTEGP